MAKRRGKSSYDHERYCELPNPLVYASMMLVYVLARRFGELDEMYRLTAWEAYQKYSRFSQILQDLSRRISITIRHRKPGVRSFFRRDEADSVAYLDTMTDAEIGLKVCQDIFTNPRRSQVWNCGVSNAWELVEGWCPEPCTIRFLMAEANDVPYRFAMRGYRCLVRCMIADDVDLLNILGEFVAFQLEAEFSPDYLIYAKAKEPVSLVVCMTWLGFFSIESMRPGRNPNYGFSEKLARWYKGRVIFFAEREHLYGSKKRKYLDEFRQSLVRSGQLKKVVQAPAAIIRYLSYRDVYNTALRWLDVLYLDLSAKGFSDIQMADVSGPEFVREREISWKEEIFWKMEGFCRNEFRPGAVRQLLFTEDGWRDERFADVCCFCGLRDFQENHYILDPQRYLLGGRANNRFLRKAREEGKRLAEIAELIRPYPVEQADEKDAGAVDCVEVNLVDVNEAGIVSGPTKQVRVKRDRAERRLLRPGDILFVYKGRSDLEGRSDLGRVGCVMECPDNWLAGQAFVIIRQKDGIGEKLPPEFLLRYLRSKEIRAYLDSKLIHRSTKAFPFEDIENLPVAAVGQEVQQAETVRLRQQMEAAAEIERLRKKLRDLES